MAIGRHELTSHCEVDLLERRMEARLKQLIDRWGALSLVLLGLLVLLPGTFEIPLLDRDEPRFSQATAEMMDRQEWTIPYFNGDYRFDKPPLTYWWMRVHYWILGKGEIGARLHSVFSSLLVAVGLFLFGRRHFDAFASWVAAFAWLTCFQVFQHGRLALADMPMIAAVFYALWAFYELTLPREDDQPRWKWFWLFYVSLGLGFLAKGPIALATPIVAILLYRLLFWRKPLDWKTLRPMRGFLVVLAMVGAWGIPALITTHGLFWQIGMGKHVIDRGMEAFNDRKVVPFYYLVTVFISLFPWIAFFGKRLRNLKSGWNRQTAFLIAWIISPYLIFLFYSTQLPHYVMPAFPALLLWMMLAFTDQDLPWGKLGSIWFWVYIGLWETLLTGLLIWVLGSDLAILSLKWGLAALLVVMFCLDGIVVSFRYRVYGFVIPLLLCIAVSQVLLGKEMRKLSPVLPIARMVEQLPPDTRLVGVGFEEPSLVFYTGRVWDFKVDKEDLLRDINSEEGRHSFYVVLDHEQIVDQLITEGWGGQAAEYRKVLGMDLKAAVSGTHVVTHVKGLNFARMRWSEIVVLFPKDPLPSS